MSNSSDQGFFRLAMATTIATYLLILVGALVRAAGAGLGCPDWPHCFGQWIPPTHADQLPLGFDRSQFNAVLTWTEYVNRLLGVSIGLLITGTTIVAFRRYPRNSVLPWATLAAFLLVGFEGWLGGQVVRSGLAPWMVSAHMLVALVIVTLLLFVTFQAANPRSESSTESAVAARVRNLSLAAIALVLVQVGIGTQVRAGIEHALDAMPDLPRALWLEQVVDLHHFHRAFAALTVLFIVGLASWIHGTRRTNRPLVIWSRTSVGLVVVQAGVGAMLAGWHLPPVSQVLHVTLASLLVGSLSLQALYASRSRS
jgi:heme a synthase